MKQRIDEKTNLYSHCIDCGSKSLWLLIKKTYLFIGNFILYMKQHHGFVCSIEKNYLNK